MYMCISLSSPRARTQKATHAHPPTHTHTIYRLLNHNKPDKRETYVSGATKQIIVRYKAVTTGYLKILKLMLITSNFKYHSRLN